jgi:hypothetical protein
VAAFRAHNCRVFLNGQDISHCVRSLSIAAAVGTMVTTTLELCVTPTIDVDGNIHLDGGATLVPPESPVPGLRVRAMQLEGWD